MVLRGLRGDLATAETATGVDWTVAARRPIRSVGRSRPRPSW